MFSVGATVTAATLSKVLGGQLLSDVQTFVAALDTMFGGFRERADVTYALLKEPTTAFVVVAAPERDALREAAYFVDRLESEGMPLAGVIVNRMQALAAPALSGSRAAAAAEQLEDRLAADAADDAVARHAGDDDLRGLTPALLRLHADLGGRRRPATRGTCDGSSPATRGCRSPRCRPARPTSTTSRGCAPSAPRSGRLTV